jgi:hypothetical protein
MSLSKYGKFIALAAVFGLAPAFAQEVTFDVPFAFTAGSQAWRAGNYQVSVSKPGILMIRNTQTSKSAFLLTTGTDSHATSATQAVMKFNQYGDHYFLSQVWVGLDRGEALQKSPAERERAKAVGPVIATVKGVGGR